MRHQKLLALLLAVMLLLTACGGAQVPPEESPEDSSQSEVAPQPEAPEEEPEPQPVVMQDGTIFPISGALTPAFAENLAAADQTQLDRWKEAVGSGLVSRIDGRTMSDGTAPLPADTAQLLLQNLQNAQLGLFEELGNPNTGGSVELAAYGQDGAKLFHCVFDDYWFCVQFATEETAYVFDGSALDYQTLSGPMEALLPPAQPAAPESSAAEPPAAEPEQEEPTEPEEESEPEPAPAPVTAQRPDYLGIGAPALRGEAEYLDDVEADILDGINYEREDVGAAPVKWDDNLADAARIRAAELYHNEYTAHTRPNGEKWISVLDRDVPVGYTSAGEILAFIGTAQNVDKIESADYWVNQWVNSSAHYECMINTGYTHAGSAVVFAWDEADQMYYGYACTIFAKW